MTEPEVIVIGAGPAGAMSALLLARSGLRVLLTERDAFPRRKLCGGCLARTGNNLLATHALGALGSITGAQRIERIDLRRGSHTLPLRIGPYRVVDRARFDADLVHAATDAGAVFIDSISAAVSADATVGLVPRRGSLRAPGVEGRRGGGWTVCPRVIIVADGLKGTALRSLPGFGWRVDPRAPVGMGAMVASLPPGCAPDAVTMLLGVPGYAGIAPLGDGRGVIAAAVDPAWVGRRHGAVPLVALLSELGLDPGLDRTDSAPGLSITAGAPGLTRTREAVEGGGGDPGGRHIFLVGDAAGYVEPFTGEGMTWALQDAQRVARHAMTAVGMTGSAYRAGEWTREHRAINRRRHLLCRLSVGLLRRPRLSGALIGAGQSQPALGTVVATAVRVMQERCQLDHLPESSVA